MAGRPKASPKKCVRCKGKVKRADGRRAWDASLCRKCWNASTKKTKVVSGLNLLQGRTAQAIALECSLAALAAFCMPVQTQAVAYEEGAARKLQLASACGHLQIDTSRQLSTSYPSAERGHLQRSQHGDFGFVSAPREACTRRH